MALHRLARVVPAPPGRPALADEHHPIRHVTRRIAFGGGDAWSAERRAHVTALFDGLASEWDTNPGRRIEAVADALDRGGPFPPGPCIEVGSGTGFATAVVAGRLAPVVAFELSAGMLARSTTPVPHVRADASALPVAGGSVAVVVLVNMFLFPAEVARVLGPDGVLVWVNTLGDATPIHLPADEVVAALPGRWRGVAADAGWGTWAAVRRRVPDEPAWPSRRQAATSSGSTRSTNSSARSRPSDGQLHTR